MSLHIPDTHAMHTGSQITLLTSYSPQGPGIYKQKSSMYQSTHQGPHHWYKLNTKRKKIYIYNFNHSNSTA